MSKGFIIKPPGTNFNTFKSLVDRSITNVTEDMLQGITNIVNYAFSSCTSLQSIEIPNSVTSIKIGAFLYCTSLQSIEIPNSVTSIGESVLRYCTSLQTVTMSPTTPPSLGAYVFIDTHSDLVIYVPAGSVETYKTASGWSYYASKIQAIPNS